MRFGLVVPHLHVWQVHHDRAGPSRPQPKIGFLKEEKIPLVQAAELVPQRLADQKKCADDGFHRDGFRKPLFLAGKTLWEKAA